MESTDAPPSLSEILTDAIRYWEPRRIAYNLVLLAIVAGCLAADWQNLRGSLHLIQLAPLFVLAVLANVCYCAAYFVEVPLQLSQFRGAWRRARIGLWLVGALFAGVIAAYWMLDEIEPAIRGLGPG